MAWVERFGEAAMTESGSGAARMPSDIDPQFYGELQAAFAGVGGSDILELDRRGEGYSWETFLGKVAAADGTVMDVAIKREPLGGIAGEYDVDREVALLAATRALGLAIPGVITHRSGQPGSRGFFVMERVFGEVPLPHNVTRLLPAAMDRERLGRQIARAMVRLHSADPADLKLPALDPAPAPEATGRIENAKWAANYERAASIKIPVLDLAFAWLDHRSEAVSGRVSLVHNDFRIGNLMVAKGRLESILDWETAHYSDPVADIAWFALRTFRGRSPLLCKLITLEAFLDEYEAAAGWRPGVESLTWWTVQSLAKSAVGCLQAVDSFTSGIRRDLRYANMAHSGYYALGWLNEMLEAREWGLV